MCEPNTLKRITQTARNLPEPAALKALAYLEDLLDIEEANRRITCLLYTSDAADE